MIRPYAAAIAIVIDRDSSKLSHSSGRRQHGRLVRCSIQTRSWSHCCRQQSPPERATCTSRSVVRRRHVATARSSPFEGVSILTPPETERIVISLLEDFQRKELDEVQQVDFSFGLDGLGRFRANAFKQRNTLRARPARRALPRAFARRARRAVGVHRPAEQAVRSRARRGPDRFRQEHHAGGDDRPHQRRRVRATS